jgi:hypothetical protein
VTPSVASAAPGTATVSRPRLVAKSGSGLITKGSGPSGGKPAPDASAVWNKNRREQKIASGTPLTLTTTNPQRSCPSTGTEKVYRRGTEKVWNSHGDTAPSRCCQGTVQLGRYR